MKIRRASPGDLLAICTDLRPIDREEILALQFHDDPQIFAMEMAALLPRAMAAFALCDEDEEPIGFLGFWLMAPGAASVGMFATSRWPEIARAAHAWSLDIVVGTIFAASLRRVECRALVKNGVARRWLGRLGFVEEGVCAALGKGGESFVTCAWVNPNSIGAPNVQ